MLFNVQFIFSVPIPHKYQRNQLYKAVGSEDSQLGTDNFQVK